MKGYESKGRIIKNVDREIWGRRELGKRGVSVIKASKYNVFSYGNAVKKSISN